MSFQVSPIGLFSGLMAGYTVGATVNIQLTTVAPRTPHKPKGFFSTDAALNKLKLKERERERRGQTVGWTVGIAVREKDMVHEMAR